MDTPARDGLTALQGVAALLNSGQPREALAAAQRLFADPGFPPFLAGDACHLAAAAAHALGMPPLAEALWREAIARGHASAEPHFNLGVLYASQQRDDDAEAAWRRATEVDPNAAPAWLQLGALLARRGRFAEADAAYLAGRRLLPHDAAAANNHGAVLAQAGRNEDAEQAYLDALRIEPDNAQALANLGALLVQLNRAGEAEAHLRRALGVEPNNAAASTNLGLALEAQKRYDEAEAMQRRALALDSRSAEIHTNLGNALAKRRGQEDEAERLHRRAIELDPASAAAHGNLGVLLADRRRDAEAEALFRRALVLRPGYALARLNLAFLLLAQGRWHDGWPLHEARHDPALSDNGIPPPELPIPMWRGESLAGLSMLVWPEQGLGDQIQFARYAALLKARGAARVTLVCSPPLARVFETLDDVDTVLPARIAQNRFVVPEVDLSGHDAWAFPISFPAHFGTTVDTVPPNLPYLRADPANVAVWAERCGAGPGLRVGVVWRGNPLHNNDAERSLPGLAALAPLWSVGGVRFFGLQAGAAEASPAAQPLVQLGDRLTDFADTAAALANLDLLISVDTSIVHLAGAIGTPCWVLLPEHKTDWRWLRERADSPWYPGTMRLFRQRARGDWAGVIDEVRVALSAVAETRRDTAR